MINNNQTCSPQTVVRKSNTTSKCLEVTSCTKAVLKTLKATDGTLYHTTDTNEFFYDWGGKRIQLDLFGTGSVDYLNKYLKKGDNVSALVNDKGYIDTAVLEKYLKDRGYDIKKVIKDEIKAELTNATDIQKLDQRVDAAKQEILYLKEHMKDFYGKEEIDITFININDEIYAIGKDIDKKIAEINKRIDTIVSSLDKKIGDVKDDVTKVSDDIKSVSDSVDGLERKISDNKASIDKNRSSIKSVSDRVDVLDRKVDNIKADILDKVSGDIKSVSDRVDSVEKRLMTIEHP